MERMDEILCYWASKDEAFPEGIRTREETGCCDVDGYMGAVGEPGHVIPD